MRFSITLALLLIFFSMPVNADTYQWVDDKGVVSFTDDPEKIPAKYRKNAEVLAVEDLSPVGTVPAQTRQPETATVPQSAEQRGEPALYGGHNEAWWRSQFSGMREELSRIQDSLPDKKTQLEQLRRKYVIYSYSRNRIAYQEKMAEIKKDEERIASLTEQLKALDAQASGAGVPFEWRQ